MRFDPVLYAMAKKGGSGGGGGSSGGDNFPIGDGNTHIWISLPEGRTSPMLGVAVKGTVTVDWGDGSAPDTLTGTSVSNLKYTPNHQYGKAGDYVITLSVDGEMAIVPDGYYPTFFGGSSVANNANNALNQSYRCAVRKVELGSAVTSVGDFSFYFYYALESFFAHESFVSIGQKAFQNCYSLRNVIIPSSVTTVLSSAFYGCSALTDVIIPGSLTSVGDYMFYRCYALSKVVMQTGVKSINISAFYECYNLTTISIPESVESIGTNAFEKCSTLKTIDFSHHTFVPALAATNAFNGIPSDCIFKIPASLYDEWVAATNWSAVAASYTFVGV